MQARPAHTQECADARLGKSAYGRYKHTHTHACIPPLCDCESATLARPTHSAVRRCPSVKVTKSASASADTDASPASFSI